MAWGRYHDERLASYGGESAVPLIIVNSQFIKAFRAWQEDDTRPFAELDFTGGFCPLKSETFMHEDDAKLIEKLKQLGGPRAKCPFCGDIIQSMHRLDFRACECGKSFITGGKECSRSSENLEFLKED